MPNEIKQAFREIASPSILLRVQINPVPAKPVATLTPPYDQVKHLLSNKPLRRPTRTRSAD